ncbi:SCP2 sterol-binding domain-containing protein [Actinokineospora cianjurensis]|uniref:SCP-2 sterol transfer family protein n=1 Tax=Actinokineospora cianjurensis TaxID=585224 RepID=A0A421B731_9PSEU|nr:SCP2 sterol-binding domain-containing protein [Actinokineospora cianjurensis]RLK60292.1 SCP-2 sterol transfer family protein [Actinokineospora cianjurensis]
MSRRRRWNRLPPVTVVDLDGLADAVDPARLTAEQFVQLIEVLHVLGDAGTGIDLAAMRTETFLRFLGRASREQVDALVAHPDLRPVVFAELFRRMAEHLAADDLRAVVHWRFTGPDGEDRFETVIDRGRCTSGPDPTADPRVTITIDPADFLRAVTGAAALPVLFLSGRVKVKGDIAFAAGLLGHFDLP